MFDCNVTINDNEIIVVPSGRIDVRSSKAFQEECLKVIDKAPTFILDFADVEYLSSAGLRVILLLQQTQVEKNRQMIMRNVNEVTMEILDTVGFLEFLTIE